MHPKTCFRFLQTVSFSLFFSLPGITAAASFYDVMPNHPYNTGITYAERQGIVTGYPDHSFHPDDDINRAEFTKIIAGATLSKEFIDSCVMGDDLLTDFITDIPPGQWFAPYVCAALDVSYVDGYPDRTFRPNNPVNFVEAAKILSMAYRLQIPPVDDPHIWYRPFVQQLAARNAIPVSITSFEQTITRGEMAEMVWRLKANITDRRSRTYEELAGENGGVETTDALRISFHDEPYETQMHFSRDNGWEHSSDLPLSRPISFVDPETYAHGELAAFHYGPDDSRAWYVLKREGNAVYVDIAAEGRDAKQSPCLLVAYHVMLFGLEHNRAIAEGYDQKVTTAIPSYCSQNP
jgi:hypothetical protein